MVKQAHDEPHEYIILHAQRVHSSAYLYNYVHIKWTNNIAVQMHGIKSITTQINVYFQIYFADVLSSNLNAAEGRGVATDLSILNSAYFLSLVLLSLTMGSVVSFTGTVHAYMTAAVLIGFVSCLCIWRVITDKQSLYHALQREQQLQSFISA